MHIYVKTARALIVYNASPLVWFHSQIALIYKYNYVQPKCSFYVPSCNVRLLSYPFYSYSRVVFYLKGNKVV